MKINRKLIDLEKDEMVKNAIELIKDTNRGLLLFSVSNIKTEGVIVLSNIENVENLISTLIEFSIKVGVDHDILRSSILDSLNKFTDSIDHEIKNMHIVNNKRTDA